jgi:hypothetical protein
MRMSKQHFDFIADTVGPIVGWPSALHDLADKLAQSNPRFDREKFLRRATNAWEEANHHIIEVEVDDEIPYY